MTKDVFQAVKQRQSIGAALMTEQEAIICQYVKCRCGLTWEPVEKVGQELCQCEIA
jgi:hypothetical protein